MSFRVGTSVFFEVSSQNSGWITTGLIGGLLYGFYTSDDDNTASSMLSCAILGGLIMGIIENLFVYVENVDPADDVLKIQR